MWVDVMFACAKPLGWRKASKCKKLFKQLQDHISIKRIRVESIIKQSCSDIAQLLQYGQIQNALRKLDKLHKDKCLLSAYNHILRFCKCIADNFSHINTQRTVDLLPTNVSEAISSLIFAASRCGELPALHSIRNLFKERYGREFEAACVDLLPGNLVNPKIKENLRVKSISDEVKLKLIYNIAKDYAINLSFHDFDRDPSKPFSERVQVVNLIYDQESLSPNDKATNCGTFVTYYDDEDETDKASHTSEESAMNTLSNGSGISDSCNKNKSEVFVIDHLALDGSIGERRMGKEKALRPTHVNHNLPEYDDVVAMQTNLKRKMREQTHRTLSRTISSFQNMKI